ncbi:hypothetical protein [Streptomyces griseosporeus]|uniref:hypothetical protein n=1 Tax=Streptomyces griseosporeus TaxID=1910 RepID=UPI00378BFE9B
MLSVLLTVLGALLLPVAVLMLMLGRGWLWGPDALSLRWRLLYGLTLAALFVLVGLALWPDARCGADCEPVVTPVYP